MKNLLLYGLLVFLLCTDGKQVEAVEFCSKEFDQVTLYNRETITTQNHPSNYKNDESCFFFRYTDQPHIRIVFSHIDLEDCCDYVEIYDKWTESDPLAPIYSTRAADNVKTITEGEEIIVGDHAIFHFSSDSTVTKSGVKFTIEPYDGKQVEAVAEFCSEEFHQVTLYNRETITTQNHPSNYENDKSCSIFRYTDKPHIRIVFSHIDLENGYDYVRIYDKWTESDPGAAIYSTRAADNVKTISEDEEIIVGHGVLFQFVSDDSVTKSGVKFTVEPYGAWMQGPSFEFCRSTETKGFIDGIEYIKSPNYPNEYEADLNCYISRRTTSSHMKIIFYYLELEPGNDMLEIYEKSSKDAIDYGDEPIYSSEANQGKKITIGEEIIVGNEVTFRFYSDVIIQYSGLMFSIEPYGVLPQEDTDNRTTNSNQPLEHHLGLNVSLGNPVQAQVDIPDMVNLPLLTKVSENVYDVLAPVIHLSSVVTMLKKKNLNFAIHQTEDREMTLELTIRAYTIYVDEDHLNFRGLKRLTILGGRLVGNDVTLLLSAPDVCERIDSGGNCIYKEKAAVMEDGADGKSGVDTPVTNIFVYQIEGNIKILFEASDGIQGEKGGDGRPGRKLLTAVNIPIAHQQMCWLFVSEDWVYRGLRGSRGEDGKDGRRGGKGGDGGSISDITIKITKLSTGSIKIHQLPGKGGQPGSNGAGGSAGPGGIGGCGAYCDYGSMLQTCGSAARGEKGENGRDGRDGSDLYQGVYGHGGTVTHPTSNIGESLRDEFADQKKLLGWIIRSGELMFQRKRSSQAADFFDFLISVLEPGTINYNEVARRRRVIASGFDFYGNDERYAPDLGWKYFKDRTDELMDAGKALEDAYNNVKRNLESDNTITSAIRNASIVTIEVGKMQINFQELQLKFTQNELNDQKNYTLKALRILEGSLESEMSEMIQLLPKAILEANSAMDAEESRRQLEIFTKILSGIGGMVTASVTGDPGSAISGAAYLVGALNDIAGGPDTCKIPLLDEATQTLEEKLRFGYEYSRMEPEDLDFSTADVSMIPEIMKSKLSKNKAALITEFKCLFKWGDGENANKLESVLNSYFYRADQRASLIWKVVDIDIELKEIGHYRNILEEGEEAYNEMLRSQSEQKRLPMDKKTLFLERIFKVLQQKETAIMKSLYDLSKAYEFISLWKFHTLEKYSNLINNMAMQMYMDTMQGMLHLEDIKQSLENERDVFLQSIRGYTTGKKAHIYTHFSEFDNVTSPHVIRDLHADGAFAITIDLKPDDAQTNGCDQCYNQRLLGVYVELIGEQDDLVNKIIYVEVSHMGDNHFLIPDHDGTDKVILLEQTPFKNGGKMLNFDSRKLFSSKNDPFLADKLSEDTYTFCEDDQDSENFFTEKPCKSPYATFSITVPRDPDLPCVKSENEWASGENCRDLDFTKFTSVRFYQKIRSWISYPSQS